MENTMANMQSKIANMETRRIWGRIWCICRDYDECGENMVNVETNLANMKTNLANVETGVTALKRSQFK